MKSQFILTNVAFFVATLLHISFTVGQTLEPNNIEIIEKNKEPTIKVEVLSEDHSNLIQIFSSTKPPNPLEKKTLYHPLEFSGDKVIFWEKSELIHQDLLDGAIQIQLKLTCNAPYITKWKIDMRNQDTERELYMNYNVQPLSRENEAPFVLNNQLNTEDLKYNLTMLTVTGFVLDFRSASISCVKYTNKSIKSQLNIFQRFEDGTKFVDGNNKNLNIYAPYIPCSVHDPAVRPGLEHKDKKGTWNKIPESLTSFEYDWKTGYRKVNGEVYTNLKKFRCLIINGKRKDNVTYTFTVEKSEISEWKTHMPILQADEYQFLPAERQIRCSLDYSKLNTANLLGTLTSLHVKTCVTPDYCFSSIHNQDMNCTHAGETCTIMLPSDAAADSESDIASTLDHQGQVSCFASIDSDEAGQTVAQDYYYTGLSGKLFLLSKPNRQDEIVDLAVWENPNHIRVSCTALKFLTSAPLKVSVTFQNGTHKFVEDAFSGIEFNNERDSRFLFHKDVRSMSVSIELLKAEGVHGFSCQAPWFNSTDWIQESKNLGKSFLKNITDLVSANWSKSIREAVSATSAFESSSVTTVTATTSGKVSPSTKSFTSWTGSTENTTTINIKATGQPPSATDSTPSREDPIIISSTAESGKPPNEGSNGKENNQNDSDQSLIIGICAATMVVVFFATIVIVVVIFRQKIDSLRKQMRELTAEEIQKFFEGNRQADRTNAGYGFIESQPFNKDYEIAKDRLEIAHEKVLGSGAFGLVLSGNLQPLPGSEVMDDIIVAVKTVLPNVEVAYFMALLTELKVMCFVGKHQNIALLHGAVTTNIRNREVYIALEFCANGDLLSFIKTYRANFVNQLTNTNSFHHRVQSQDASNSTASTSFSITCSVEDTSNQTISYSTMDLVNWAVQISNGMTFISEKNVIHGDLAARNVLLTADKIAKVSDFGLSRQLHNYSTYVKKSKTPLPWKWMAIESLRDMQFSVQSDVWAFGVTMFEVFSLGTIPYPGCTWTLDFVDDLVEGLRLKAPKFGNEEIFSLMLDCMKLEPADRATFPEIKCKLEEIKRNLVSQLIATPSINYIVL